MISRSCSAGQREQRVARGAIAVGPRISHSTPAGVQSGHAGQIDRGLGVSGAAQHAALLGHQRKQVPGPHEVGRLAGRVEDRADGRGPLLGRDARPAAVMVDRHGERRAQKRRVVLDHRRQIEPLGDLGQDRHAKLPAAVGDHEVDDFGRHLFGGADEIAFVLAVFGIDDDDDVRRGDGLDGRFDGREISAHGAGILLR